MFFKIIQFNFDYFYWKTLKTNKINNNLYFFKIVTLFTFKNIEKIILED